MAMVIMKRMGVLVALFAAGCGSGEAIETTATDAAELTFAETGGLVVMEAENFTANTSQGGKSWTTSTASSPSNGSAMIATPDTGAVVNTGYTTGSPRLDYQVTFTQTGTYQVWVRGRAGGSVVADSDSVHVGLDGAAVASADRISTFTASFGWSRATLDSVNATLSVTSAGTHTINVWMREDGFVIDKLLLTKDATFVPTGNGPAETLSGSGTCGNGVCEATETCSSCSADCGACPALAFLEASQMVSMEAEHFDSTSANGSSDTWTQTANASASGGQEMRLGPDSGDTWTANVATTAPRLSYRVNFVTTGTWNMWVRGRASVATMTSGDSCWGGLESTVSSTYYDFDDAGALGWFSKTITVSSPGVQTINLWGREDGFNADKIVLAKSTTFTPTNGGPAESARGTGACPVGSHDGGNGACVPNGTCSTGYHDGGNGACVPNGTCSTGYHDGGSGACVPNGTCSSGYHDSGTGSCIKNVFASGPCITTTNLSDMEIFASGGSKIYRRAVSGGSSGSWAAIPNLDASQLDASSDLDCAGGSNDIHLVGTGANPVGSYLHAFGFGTAYNAFTRELGTWTPNAATVPGASIAMGLGSADTRYQMAFAAGNPVWAFVQSPTNTTALTPGNNFPLTAGPDIAWQQTSDSSHFLMASFQSGNLWYYDYSFGFSSSWLPFSNVAPPSGTTYGFSPTICASTNPTTGDYTRHVAAVANGKLYYTRTGTGWPTTFDPWTLTSSVDAASSPDCLVTSDNTVHIVFLTRAGSITHVYRTGTNPWSVQDLGGVCPTGYHDGGSGTCLADGACSTGFHNGGSGVCVPNGTCSSGFHDDGTGACIKNVFVSGPCITTTNLSDMEIFASSGSKIYRRAVSGGSSGSWASIPNLDGTQLDARSDLDCTSNGSTIQIVGTGVNPVGSYMRTSGFGTAYSAFARDLSTWTPNTANVPGASVATWPAGGDSRYQMAFAAGNPVWAFVQSSTFVTALSPGNTFSLTAAPDIAMQQTSDASHFLMVSFQNGNLAYYDYNFGFSTYWLPISNLAPPTGTTYGFSPTICASTNPTTGDYTRHVAAVANGKLYYTRTGTGWPTTFDPWTLTTSSVDAASSPDCFVTSDNTVHIVLLSPTGSITHVSRTGTSGLWATQDLGGY